MKLAVIGSGYVGLISGVGLALNGHEVECIDNDAKKVELINSAKPPIYELGLEEALKKLVPEKLRASTGLKEAVLNSDASFVCVGTPCDEEGKCNLNAVEAVVKSIGSALKENNSFHVVVVKSTVVPTTTEKIVLPLLEEASGKKCGKDFGLCMNPEFLREGFALEDFLKPDRIVCGTSDEKTREIMNSIYSSFNSKILFTSFSEAEMIKYASNSFLSTKISFINEIGNLCKKLGINTYNVAEGVGMDKRISPFFLNAGIGFGGSCFPKDVRALASKAREVGVGSPLLDSVIEVNERQPSKLIELAKKKTELKNKKVGILGLAFKPGTDDVRESRAIPVINELLKEEAKVLAHDPKAEENMKRIFSEVNYFDSAQKLVDESEIIFILTEWEHFSKLDFKDKKVFDGRNIFKNKASPKNYEGICW
ncbi:MAG: UDP-glucose/GDP-mannose dehydrogenase family protein [archaeon]